MQTRSVRPRQSSETIELPVMPDELELAGMLLHQLLEAAERHNLPQRRVHSASPTWRQESLWLHQLTVYQALSMSLLPP